MLNAGGRNEVVKSLPKIVVKIRSVLMMRLLDAGALRLRIRDLGGLPCLEYCGQTAFAMSFAEPLASLGAVSVVLLFTQCLAAGVGGAATWT